MKYDFIIKAALMGFLITLTLSAISEVLLTNFNVLVGFIVLLSFIVLGVFFDMIGIAVTAADISPFNAMAAKKEKGGKTGVEIIQNAPKVASILTDIIGDICGIISGTAAVAIAIVVADISGLSTFSLILLLTSTTAALTIGGKALGKEIAMKYSKEIVLIFAKTIARREK